MLALLATVVGLPQLPGANLLGAGYDAAYGRTPADIRPIFKFNWGSKVFTNPSDQSIVYSIPDEYFVTVHTSRDEDVTTAVSYTASSYASSLTNGISLSDGGKFRGAPFSASAGVSDAATHLSKRSEYSSFTRSEMFVTIYQATLPNPFNLTLSDDFFSDAEALPEYTPDAPEYKDFIGRYGTHCLLGGYFGGKGVSQVYVNTQRAQSYSTDDVSAQAGVKFKFGAKISSEDAQSWFNGDDQSRSEITTYMEGGDPGLAGDLEHWDDWISSFFKYPALVYKDKYPMSMISIEQLVPASKRDDVTKALSDYMEATPYPDDPNCADSVLCMGDSHFGDDTCCQKDYPSCCYQGGQTVCYANLLDTCCSDHACNAGDPCCGKSCMNPGNTCCGDDGRYCGNNDSCCNGGDFCCENHGTCCSSGSDHWCCDQGYGCITWPIEGCNPLEATGVNTTLPPRSTSASQVKSPVNSMNDFVELMRRP